MGKPITFSEAVSSVRTISPAGAAVQIRQYTLSAKGKAAMSGQSGAARPHADAKSSGDRKH